MPKICLFTRHINREATTFFFSFRQSRYVRLQFDYSLINYISSTQNQYIKDIYHIMCQYYTLASSNVSKSLLIPLSSNYTKYYTSSPSFTYVNFPARQVRLNVRSRHFDSPHIDTSLRTRRRATFHTSQGSFSVRWWCLLVSFRSVGIVIPRFSRGRIFGTSCTPATARKYNDRKQNGIRKYIRVSRSLDPPETTITSILCFQCLRGIKSIILFALIASNFA